MPVGVALALCLRWGARIWPGLWAGAFALAVAHGDPHWAAVVSATGDAAGPLVAAYWMQRRAFHPELSRPRDFRLLFGFGVVLAPLLVALNTAFTMRAFGLIANEPTVSTLLLNSLAAGLGVVAVGVPSLWISWRSLAGETAPRRGIAAALVLAGAACAWLAFARVGQGPVVLVGFLMLAPFALVGWLRLHSGAAVAGAAVLAVCVAAAAGAARAEPAAVSGFGAWLWLPYGAALSGSALCVATLHRRWKRAQARWQRLLEGMDEGVCVWDAHTGRADCSARWRQLLGCDAQLPCNTLEDWLARVHGDDVPALRRALAGLHDPMHERVALTLRVATADAGTRRLEGQAIVFERDADARPTRFAATLNDCTDDKAVAERQHRLEAAFRGMHDGLLLTDSQHRVLEVNAAFCRITGESRQTLAGTVPGLWRALTGANAPPAQREEMWAALRAGSAWRHELIERRRNGDPRALQITISTLDGTPGAPAFYMLVVSDMTSNWLKREQLERQAYLDPLTQLPNRMRLAQLLQQAIDSSDRDGRLLTVCYLDLDHFKPLNDRHGQAVGDRMLVELARRLRVALRTADGGGDCVARLGGDEFVLLIHSDSPDESRLAVERVLGVIAVPHTVPGSSEPLQITASIGATLYPMDAADADTLLRHADHAMYGAKQAGRSGYVFFDAEHSRQTEARYEALGRMQQALEGNEFILYYQPKVDMASGRVLGVEALLRWAHPEQGLVAPGRFLPLLEHTALSARIGDWVLVRALDQLAQWQRRGLDFSVSVNVSARHLQEPRFAERLHELLALHERPLAGRLELEVLETAALADVPYTCALMEECRAFGVRFALDDFGTGYSTQTYLKRLPLDVLKIDRSFVHNMLSDPEDMAIVQGVITLARTFGCVAVAEGVESVEQAQRLVALGCHVGQGNGVAEPMPAAQVEPWVRAYHGLRRSDPEPVEA